MLRLGDRGGQRILVAGDVLVGGDLGHGVDHLGGVHAAGDQPCRHVLHEQGAVRDFGEGVEAHGLVRVRCQPHVVGGAPAHAGDQVLQRHLAQAVVASAGRVRSALPFDRRRARAAVDPIARDSLAILAQDERIVEDAVRQHDAGVDALR